MSLLADKLRWYIDKLEAEMNEEYRYAEKWPSFGFLNSANAKWLIANELRELLDDAEREEAESIIELDVGENDSE